MGLKSLGIKAINNMKKKLGIKSNGSSKKLGNKTNIKKSQSSPQEGMTSDEKLSAKIASDAYEKKRKSSIDGFDYYPDLSDTERAVYHNKTTNQTRIGYKGTNSIKDLKVDLTDKSGNILTGTQRNNEMYKKDINHFDKVKNRFGNNSEDITLSGHSLGSSRVFNVSKNKNVRGHGFNTGRGVDSQMKLDKKKCNEPNPPPFCDKMTSLRTGNDPLSYLNKDSYGKHKQFKSKSFNAHSMDNFLE